jgi:hypothetical protein
MPRATVIRDAIEGATLREKVKAIASIAATLARLAEHGVAHRDLKPDNLYNYDDGWAVGPRTARSLPAQGRRAWRDGSRRIRRRWRIGPFS